MVPGLSNSSSRSDSSTTRTLSRQGGLCSTSSSSSSSSPTVSEIQTREREVRTESDISPVDERSGRPDVDQANKIEKQIKRNERRSRATRCLPDSGRASSDSPEWLQEFRENLVDDRVPEHRESQGQFFS